MQCLGGWQCFMFQEIVFADGLPKRDLFYKQSSEGSESRETEESP